MTYGYDGQAAATRENSRTGGSSATTGDLLVGADGFHSSVRAQLLADAQQLLSDAQRLYAGHADAVPQ
jgi:2-polyprenyl-6-methoxyphenol hydroxylase-like FAD-dependent oxidoreductase